MGSCQVFQIKHQCPLKRDNNLWLILSIQFHLLLHGMVLAIEMCVCVCVCVCVDPPLSCISVPVTALIWE